MINWDARLLQIAEEHPDASGMAGELLRARLAQQAAHVVTHDLQLAHARAREAVVTGARLSLRCGALLLNAPAGDVAHLLRFAGISPQAGINYTHMALGHPELARISAKRFGRISEAQALHLLRGERSDGLADPVTALRSLHELQS
ncbi:MAG: hypothetical protein P4L96_07525 [Rhodoferax sp.]|nr:hypothetical protein [Rhodoferax sp.]